MTTIVPALLIALVMGAIAGLSVWVQQPILAPSLASAAFAQLLSPTQPSAKVYITLVGQLVGVVAGLAGVHLAAAAAAPHFMGDNLLVWHRALAVVIAALLAALAQPALKATNPAGGATAAIVAIGAETADLAGVARLVVGILLVTLLGELARVWLVGRAR